MMRVKLPNCLGGADLVFSLKRIPGKRDQAAFVRHISAKVDILAIRLKRRGIKLGSSEKMRESILRDLEHFESECIAEGKLFDFHEDLIPEVGSIAETLEWAADTIDLDLAILERCVTLSYAKACTGARRPTGRRLRYCGGTGGLSVNSRNDCIPRGLRKRPQRPWNGFLPCLKRFTSGP